MPNTEPTAGELFIGGGGATTGLRASGFKSLWGIERDEKIAHVAQLNLPETKVINSCVSQVDPRLLGKAILETTKEG